MKETDISSTNLLSEEIQLYNDVCNIIDSARNRLATYVNKEVVMTNWYVGKRIKEDVLYNKRAEYGKQIVKKLAENLVKHYGTGWSEKKLRHCLRAAETFSQEEIVSATQRQLTWTHLKSLMYIKDPLARQFYMEMIRIEHWDTRTLGEKIDGQLYERTAISRKPEEVIKRELEQVKDNNKLLPDLLIPNHFQKKHLATPAYPGNSYYETPGLATTCFYLSSDQVPA